MLMLRRAVIVFYLVFGFWSLDLVLGTLIFELGALNLALGLTKYQEQSSKFKDPRPKTQSHFALRLCVVHRLDRPLVDAAARLLANTAHFAEHLQAITGNVDLASFSMIPAHRNLLKSQAGAVRDVE